MKTTTNGNYVCSFTLAVANRFKGKDGEKLPSDFIRCVAWKKSAELLSKYCQKGSKIGVNGSIHTRQYEKEGQKINITEVVCNEFDGIEFLMPRGESSGNTGNADADTKNTPSQQVDANTGYVQVSDDDLPF